MKQKLWASTLALALLETRLDFSHDRTERDGTLESQEEDSSAITPQIHRGVDLWNVFLDIPWKSLFPTHNQRNSFGFFVTRSDDRTEIKWSWETQGDDPKTHKEEVKSWKALTLEVTLPLILNFRSNLDCTFSGPSAPAHIFTTALLSHFTLNLIAVARSSSLIKAPRSHDSKQCCYYANSYATAL